MKRPESTIKSAASAEPDYNQNLLKELAITKTAWKSHDLSKINALRAALKLPLRTEALPERTYDKEALDKFISLQNEDQREGMKGMANLVIVLQNLAPAPEGVEAPSPSLAFMEAIEEFDLEQALIAFREIKQKTQAHQPAPTTGQPSEIVNEFNLKIQLIETRMRECQDSELDELLQKRDAFREQRDEANQNLDTLETASSATATSGFASIASTTSPATLAEADLAGEAPEPDLLD